MAEYPIPNVIIFGETGVGKSSIVNMILGHDEAKVSPDATGCTFQSDFYPAEINGTIFNLHDTVGLGEVKTGTVVGTKAIKNLYRLVKKLSDADSGGINLLVFVVKRGRLTETIQKNYTLFYKAFCESQVPIVIVVTGCDNDEPMDAWWTRNEQTFVVAGLSSLVGHACVCAYRGRRTRQGGYVNDEQFQESQEIIERLIPDHCKQPGWKKPPTVWFKRMVRGFFGMLGKSAPVDYTTLRTDLSSAFSPAEVDQIVDVIKDG